MGQALYDPEYDRLWEICEDLGVPVNSHAGTGLPDYGRYKTSSLLYINEVGFYSMRPLVQMILSGVFERFPRLKFAVSEQGCSWAPDLMRQLDTVDLRVKRTGRIGELFYSEDEQLPLRPSEYFRRNVWVGATMPSAQDIAVRETLGEGKFMWGSDYPHNEGTYRLRASAFVRSCTTWTSPSCGSCSPPTPPNCTTSISMRLHRSRPSTGRHPPRSRSP